MIRALVCKEDWKFDYRCWDRTQEEPLSKNFCPKALLKVQSDKNGKIKEYIHIVKNLFSLYFGDHTLIPQDFSLHESQSI